MIPKFKKNVLRITAFSSSTHSFLYHWADIQDLLTSILSSLGSHSRLTKKIMKIWWSKNNHTALLVKQTVQYFHYEYYILIDLKIVISSTFML